MRYIYTFKKVAPCKPSWYSLKQNKKCTLPTRGDKPISFIGLKLQMAYYLLYKATFTPKAEGKIYSAHGQDTIYKLVGF